MSEYDDYLKDQKEDGIFDPEFREMGKEWIYKYCDHLIKDLLNDVDASSWRILDVGCREFFTYDYFQNNFKMKHESPVGIDVCNLAFDYAYQNDKEIFDIDAHTLDRSFWTEEFDLVVSFHALEHMYDIQKVVQNCFNVLKEEGYFYFAVPVPCKNERRGHWADIPSEEFMVKLCEEAGFKKVYSKIYNPGEFRNEQEMVALFQK